MRAVITCLCAVVAGCATGEFNTTTQDDAGSAEDALPDVHIRPGVVINYVDASADVAPEVSYYNPCLTRVDRATVYPRLTEIDCTDSNGSTYIDAYNDSDLLIDCEWRTTSYMDVRCVPRNDQSSAMYTDSNCSDAIALVATNHNKPVSKYIGVDDSSDAGKYVVIYNIGLAWSGNMMYYKSSINGVWSCDPTYMDFLNIGFFHVGDVVDPIIFVKK